MQRTLSVIRSAGRRRACRTFVQWTGPTLVVATALGLSAALADRLIGPGLAWWHFIVWPIAAAAATGAVFALARRDTPLRAAVEVDTSLRLRDRLGSALALSERANGDPFIALVIDEAERAAATARVARAVPIRWGTSWAVWPLLAGIAAGVALLVEPKHMLDRRDSSATPRFAPAFVEQAKQAIEQAARTAETPAAVPLSAEDQSPRDILDRLARELEEGRRTPDEALSSAAGVLEESAKHAETSAAEARLASDHLRQALSNVASEPAEAAETPGGAAVRNLREGLSRGDLDAAADALAELERRIESATPEERLRLGEEFARLARELAEQAEKDRARTESASRRPEENLLDHGLTPDQIDALRNADRREIEQRLREQGLNEEAAHRLAGELERERQERAARERSSKDMRELSDAARDAARELSQEAPPDESSHRQPQQQQNRQPPQSGQQQDTGQPDRTQGQDKPQGQPTPSQGAPAPVGEKSPERDQPQSASEPQASRSGEACEEGTSGSCEGVRRMREQIHQMADRERNAERDARRADDLRREAQRLLEQASPEERERLALWAREQMRETGGVEAGSRPGVRAPHPGTGRPFGTAEVDARRSGDQQRVAAERRRPGGEKPDPAVSRRPLAEELAEARDAAEKAVEDQVIPARYRNVQEFYRRAIQRAKEAPKTEPQPLAPAAEDVKK